MRQSEGRFLLSLAEACLPAKGMALYDTRARTAPSIPKFHVQVRRTSLVQMKRSTAFFYPYTTVSCHTGFTTQEDEVD